jgi:hypothetical protein
LGIFQKGKIPSGVGPVFCAGFDLESEITREKGHSNRFSNIKILFYLGQFLPQLRKSSAKLNLDFFFFWGGEGAVGGCGGRNFVAI